MRSNHKIAVIIPALNEEKAIGKVIDAIPEWVDDIIVVDNGSTDLTCSVVESCGAMVLKESHRGYGSACLKGIRELNEPDIVVFLDGDFSDYPEEMDSLVDPIIEDKVEMVIGSRISGKNEPGSLTLQARFGNWFACFLIRLFWGVRYTDLGPFRAIRYDTLVALGMQDPDYGWTVEMQIRAVCRQIRSMEVPVSYRNRIGQSKVSGTLRGVLGAGFKIMSTILSSALLNIKPSKNKLLAVYTRYPIPGKTKTRLIPAIGEEMAAEVQRDMTERIVGAVEYLKTGILIDICFTGSSIKCMEEWLGDIHRYRSQGSGNLGDKMERTLKRAFKCGISNVIIIGTDCPDIDAELIASAFDSLKKCDLVIGPAFDGGYYLIGLKKGVSEKALEYLFDDISWGSDKVLETTLDRASEMNLKVDQLVTLSDIDVPEDLEKWAEGQVDVFTKRHCS